MVHFFAYAGSFIYTLNAISAVLLIRKTQGSDAFKKWYTYLYILFAPIAIVGAALTGQPEEETELD